MVVPFFVTQTLHKNGEKTILAPPILEVVETRRSSFLLFQTLRLLFFPNPLTPTFIPEPTLISDFRACCV